MGKQSNSGRHGTAALALGALGVVYGDIGTSPLYTIQVIFSQANGITMSPTNIIGAVSAVLWALMLVVTLKYVILVLRADNRGEGGIMALLALAVATVKSLPMRKRLLILGAFGAALFYGDSILTPAISVLSAVEGLQVVSPQFATFVIPIAVAILVGLFAMQSRGTATVGKFFGPVIVLWFAVLGSVGIWQIQQYPAILAALNPLHALHFLLDRGAGVFIAVGAVTLAITGAEALYADMGHFGKRAIRLAWILLVLPALALNYLGQGALLLANPAAAANPFYLAFPATLLVPAVVLATLATIIASQAVISGAYSLTRQAMQLGFLPRMQIVQTSAAAYGQIYLPAVNWTLLCAVLAVTLGFKTSSALATAYGIAVTGTMLITTMLTFFVVRYGWRYPLWLAVGATGSFILLDALLLVSCSAKFIYGGWFPVALSLLMLTMMWTWKQGREVLIQFIKKDDPKLEDFVANVVKSQLQRVERTAVFLVSDPSSAPQALLHNLKHNRVLHETNLVLTVVFEDVPTVAAAERIRFVEMGCGFWQLTLRYGFMDNPDIPQALLDCKLPGVAIDLYTTSFFLSREVVVPVAGGQLAKWRERLFAAMSRNAGSAVEYFNIPMNSVIELGTRVHI